MKLFKKRMIIDEQVFLFTDDCADILGISESYAYVVIRELNKELADAGYLTLRGKVDCSYLYKRFFSPNAESGEKPIQEGR